MEWAILILLAVAGMGLLLLEFLVIPGISIAGILGLAAVGTSIYLGYSFFGAPTGHFVLAGVVAFGGVLTWYALQAKTWRRLSLHSKIEGAVEGVDASIKPGDTGVTVGRLAPMGQVQVGDATVEAQSLSGYVDPGRKVEVVKVFKDKIVVKLKTSEHGE